MKYKMKQYLALSLSVLTLMNSIPITSYAAMDVGGNGGGGTNTSGVGRGGDFATDRGIETIGLRMSLVDAYHPEEVISDTYHISVIHIDGTR